MDFTGYDTRDASDAVPLRLVDLLLFPAALAIVVVTFVYVMAYDKLLSLTARKAPIREDREVIRRAAAPLQDSPLQPVILVSHMPG